MGFVGALWSGFRAMSSSAAVLGLGFGFCGVEIEVSGHIGGTGPRPGREVRGDRYLGEDPVVHPKMHERIKKCKSHCRTLDPYFRKPGPRQGLQLPSDQHLQRRTGCLLPCCLACNAYGGFPKFGAPFWGPWLEGNTTILGGLFRGPLCS